jgi:hypothetical protein
MKFKGDNNRDADAAWWDTTSAVQPIRGLGANGFFGAPMLVAVRGMPPPLKRDAATLIPEDMAV